MLVTVYFKLKKSKDNIGVVLDVISLRYNNVLNSKLGNFSQQFAIWVHDQMEFELSDGKNIGSSLALALINFVAAEDLIYIIDGEKNWFYFVGFMDQLLPKLYAGQFNLTSLTYMDNFYGKN